MEWTLGKAKNGELTLMLNGLRLYSQYSPRQQVERFIQNEVNRDATGYVLIGLGLGYHLEFLQLLAGDKEILVYYFEQQEKLLFDQHTNLETKHVIWINDVQNLTIPDGYQVIIPYAWLKAIDEDHPLMTALEDIKIRQISFARFEKKMHENFVSNLSLHVPIFSCFKKPTQQNTAYLVSSGPSLNETVNRLKDSNAFILCVGSALSVLLQNNIMPDAVIISDAQDNIIKQIQPEKYKGPLFFVTTANHKAVCKHTGERYIIPQIGYEAAEKFANQYHYPLLESGGSVATIGLSLLDYLNFETIILFGQDFGFSGERSHATLSTSGRNWSSQKRVLTVIANDGTSIQTTTALRLYLNWFERKIKTMRARVFTTALAGAKIEGAPYIETVYFE